MEYNGIKWFDGKGFKLPDALEDKIEQLVNDDVPLKKPTGIGVGHAIIAQRAVEDYKDFLKSMTKYRFDCIKVVLDCANGAASGIAYDVFKELGADVISRSSEPDGNNINFRCGSTHPENIQDLVTGCGGDIGFAFDGDADRVIATDELGNIVDGDRIMGMCAQAMHEDGTLVKNTLVLTVMSNLGLKRRMKELNINVEVTAVGDRYVMERMIEGGYVLGGEQSGHIIFLDKNTTGDGILTAIEVMNVYKRSGMRMSRLAQATPIFPQVLINVIVANEDKPKAMWDSAILQKIDEVTQALGDFGRVLVRASGTEPLIRVMIEGQDEKEIHSCAISIAKLLEERYNGRIKI